MKKTGIGFDQVVDYCHEGKMKELAEKVPLYIAVNDMVVKFLPSPIEARRSGSGSSGTAIGTARWGRPWLHAIRMGRWLS